MITDMLYARNTMIWYIHTGIFEMLNSLLDLCKVGRRVNFETSSTYLLLGLCSVYLDFWRNYQYRTPEISHVKSNLHIKYNKTMESRKCNKFLPLKKGVGVGNLKFQYFSKIWFLLVKERWFAKINVSETKLHA